MFFYLYKVLFSGFLWFNGNFMDARYNSKYSDYEFQVPDNPNKDSLRSLVHLLKEPRNLQADTDKLQVSQWLDQCNKLRLGVWRIA